MTLSSPRSWNFSSMFYLKVLQFQLLLSLWYTLGFLSGSVGKQSACNAGAQETQIQSLSQKDSLEEEDYNPLQYSCLGTPMNRRAWWATVHGVAKGWTWLSAAQGCPIECQFRSFAILNYYFLFSIKCSVYGEGNGTPLQYCCPENPMDGGAW